MKPYIFTLLALFLSAATIQAQENKEHAHNDHLSTLITEYLAAKDALVADNFEVAQNHISNFTKEVRSNNEMNDHKEHQKMHEIHHSTMLMAVEKASSAKNIGKGAKWMSDKEEIRNPYFGKKMHKCGATVKTIN